LEDVTRELESALGDPRRQLEFVLLDGACSGYLDLKFDYPHLGDVTVNLLLIAEIRQRQGIGAHVMRALEARLRGRVTRILAGVFGENPGAARFWEGLGYHFAVDARPVLSWYAKALEGAVLKGDPAKPEAAQVETAQLETPQLEAAR
jgi:GNAT superfamily N-acetyltransferase